MTGHKNFNNESQDARRHDQHQATHPEEKTGKHSGKITEKNKSILLKHDKKK